MKTESYPLLWLRLVPVPVKRCLFIYELRCLVNFLVVCSGDKTFFILFILLQQHTDYHTVLFRSKFGVYAM